MNHSADSHADNLVQRLQELGIETGVARSGKLLRIDNRKSLANLDRQLLEQALQPCTLREIFLHGPGHPLNDLADLLAGQLRLQILDVEGSLFSDESINKLQHLPDLRLLNVRSTAVTPACIAALRKIMIGARIIG